VAFLSYWYGKNLPPGNHLYHYFINKAQLLYHADVRADPVRNDDRTLLMMSPKVLEAPTEGFNPEIYIPSCSRKTKR
jgi:hypothetical protein